VESFFLMVIVLVVSMNDELVEVHHKAHREESRFGGKEVPAISIPLTNCSIVKASMEVADVTSDVETRIGRAVVVVVVLTAVLLVLALTVVHVELLLLLTV
jgi:hypothetical protein